jgi:hypothetical protein
VLACQGGGGNWEEAFAETESALSLLETASAKTVPLVFTRFLWRWSGILGIRPSLDSVVDVLGKGAHAWLKSTETIAPEQLFRYTMDEASAIEASQFCRTIIARALGRPLESFF